MTKVAGKGYLVFRIKKHGSKRAGADTGLTAVTPGRIHLNGVRLWILG
jgi:hypothetical protein